jgi:hypothetical protein
VFVGGEDPKGGKFLYQEAGTNIFRLGLGPKITSPNMLLVMAQLIFIYLPSSHLIVEPRGAMS